MKTFTFGRALLTLYIFIFLFYLIAPLVIMGGAAFNDSRFPSISPWVGFTDRWFVDLYNDSRLWLAVTNTVLVAVGVVILSVPLGAAGAILIFGIDPRF